MKVVVEIVVMVIIEACTGESAPTPQWTYSIRPYQTVDYDPLPTTIDVAAIYPLSVRNVAEAQLRFAIDLHKYTIKRQQQDSNVFFSPYSIHVAMAMMHLGAMEVTKDQLHDGMHLGQQVDDKDLAAVYSSLNTRFGRANQTVGVVVRNANRMYAQDGLHVKDNFGKLLNAYYDTQVEMVDFANNGTLVRNIVNEFISNATEGMIRNIMTYPPDRATKAIFVNAVYFLGSWKHQFSELLTADARFYMSANRTVMVPTMYSKFTTNYAHNADLMCSMLQLPYKNNDYSMFILLPDTNTSLEWLEKRLSLESLLKFQAKLHPNEINVYLPKFKLRERLNLKDALQAKGIYDLFDPTYANLAAISEDKPLYLDDIIHEAAVEVNENGTEASAATIETMVRILSVERNFKINRPFLFYISEVNTGFTMFWGRVGDPVE